MTCLEASRNIGAHAAGQLPLAAALHLNQHLRECAWCREHYDAILERQRVQPEEGAAAPDKWVRLRGRLIGVADEGPKPWKHAGWMCALRPRQWAMVAGCFGLVIVMTVAARTWSAGPSGSPPASVVQASTRPEAPRPVSAPPTPSPVVVNAVASESPVKPAAPPPRRRRVAALKARPARLRPESTPPAASLEPPPLASAELPLGRFAAIVEAASAPPPPKVAYISGLGPEPVAVPVTRPPYAQDLPAAAVVIHNLGPDPVMIPVRRRTLATVAGLNE